MIKTSNKYYFGWKKQLPDFRDYKFTVEEKILKDLPSKIDLRKTCPPVVSQLELGSCTANAIGAAHRYDQIKQKAKIQFQPSRLFIYYNERVIEGTVKSDSGAEIRDGIKTLNQKGVCTETTWPYVVSKFKTKPPVKAFTEGLLHQSVKYQAVTQTLDQMKGTLASGFPFVYGFTVYSSFENASVAKTGIVPMSSKNESFLGGHAVMCFTEDTKVSLVDGRELNFKELIEEFRSGEKFGVYSCDKNGKIVRGLAHSPRKTGEKQDILKITLDNGEIIRCTKNHQFLLRDNTYKEAQYLNEGESLMPLYKDFDDRGYEKIYLPNNNKWEYTHRLFVNDIPRKKMVVHHIDFNKHNNNSENLIVMTWGDHTKLHNEFTIKLNDYAKSDEGRNKSRELMINLWADPVWRAERLLKNKENGYKTSALLLKENRNGFQIFDKEKLQELGHLNGLKSKGKSPSEEAIKKQILSYKTHIENDDDLRNRLNEIRRENFKNYNDKIKSGEEKPTEKQIECRRNNGKNINKKLTNEEKSLRSYKTAYNRWNKDKYSTFEEYYNTKMFNNHKIFKIESDGIEDVYDLTVEEYHNFALTSGVFVHNCVGYDDFKKWFITMNSWGKSWGDKGFFYIPYDYLTNPNLASDFWVIQIIEI